MSVKEALPAPSAEDESKDRSHLVNPNVKAAVDAFELADQVLKKDTYDSVPPGENGFKGKGSSISYDPLGSNLTSRVNGYEGKLYQSTARLVGSEERPEGISPNSRNIDKETGRYIDDYYYMGDVSYYGSEQRLEYTLPHSKVQVEGKGAVKQLTGKRAERAADIIHRRAAREVGDRAIQAAKAKIDKLQQGIDKVEG